MPWLTQNCKPLTAVTLFAEHGVNNALVFDCHAQAHGVAVGTLSKAGVVMDH